MDTAQWPEQGIGVVKVVPMEGNNNSPGAVAVNNNTKAISSAAAPRPQKPQALNCPRCNSAHTKFCYYNNYSLTQPRYFCKTCRRYWTEGGSLRNVPVGGGSRKNKRSSSSSNPTIAASSSSSLSKNIKLPHEIITSNSQNPNSKIIYHDQGQDLNLAYPPTGPSTYNSTATGISEFVEFPSATSSHHHHQFSQLLKSGIGGRGSFTSFMSMIPVSDSSNNNSAAIYSSSGGAGLPFQEFSKPITSGVNFSLDQQHGFESSGGGGVYGSLQLGVHQESSGSNNHAKLFNFPFEDLKQQPVLNSSTTSTQDPELMDQQSRGTTVTTTNTTQGDHHHNHHHHHHHHHQSPAGYWNNINGGGSW